MLSIGGIDIAFVNSRLLWMQILASTATDFANKITDRMFRNLLQTRQETWFFLSAWPDNTLANSIAIFSTDEMAQLAAGNTTVMPDPDTACGSIECRD